MNMKRIVCILLVFAVSFVSLFSCSEYKPPVNSGGGGGSNAPELDDDPTNDFTVSLTYHGEAFAPTTAIDVYWDDGFDIFVAPLDEMGIARIDGLDGDYKVTLSSCPTGYAYDVNGYEATNFNRNITIELHDLNIVIGAGDSLDNCMHIMDTGIYSVTIKEPGERVYFEYAPQINGVYSVESWASTAEDEINPIAYAYLGSSHYKYGEYEVTDLGAVGSFTRNFVHTVKIADENISSGGGSVTFTFAVTAENKSGVYPITYSFAIKRDGGFDYNRAEKVMVPVSADFSHFDFDAFDAMAGGTIVGAETLYLDKDGNEKPGAYVFDARNYKIWEIEDGGDGVYHVYDEEKYATTDGYGPILVAYVSKACRFVTAFTEIEAAGNSNLTVNGYENHKQFIEGWEALASGGFYCLNDCPCHSATEVNRACPTGCKNCRPGCRQCPPELMNKVGYAQLCNADGVAPVTKELAEFLQKYSISQRFFADGEGWAENLGIHAYEDSQWLFACGYYK
ncbi:MAG: hypothetical protein IJD79_09415 [Clostridia bacterium]|nr:hypothetical protein [Clostridia bacterium]